MPIDSKRFPLAHASELSEYVDDQWSSAGPQFVLREAGSNQIECRAH